VWVAQNGLTIEKSIFHVKIYIIAMIVSGFLYPLAFDFAA